MGIVTIIFLSCNIYQFKRTLNEKNVEIDRLKDSIKQHTVIRKQLKKQRNILKEERDSYKVINALLKDLLLIFRETLPTILENNQLDGNLEEKNDRKAIQDNKDN